MARPLIIGLSSYLPPHITSCEELYKLRVEENKYTGWASYISASLIAHGSGKYEVGPVILPSLCRRTLRIPMRDFGVWIAAEEFPVKKISRGLRDYSNYNQVASFIKEVAKTHGEVILHAQGLFSVNFARQLLYLYKELKKMGIVIVAQQQSSPPYKYYNEAYPGLKTRIFSIIAELLYRSRARFIDGYIVMNKKTYSYLVDERGIDKELVIYQHDGVDFEKVSPEKYSNREETQWPSGCAQKLILVSHITRDFGGYTKGVTLAPKILKELNRQGYRACLTIVGDIIDTELARWLREKGVVLTGHLRHNEALEYIASADIYILPAHPRRYYGGITVAVIEALALNKPVVSPTLEHVPRDDIVKYLGVKTPWVTEKTLKDFIDAVIYAIDNYESFKPRQYAQKIYDIRVMVANIERLYYNAIKNNEK